MKGGFGVVGCKLDDVSDVRDNLACLRYLCLHPWGGMLLLFIQFHSSICTSFTRIQPRKRTLTFAFFKKRQLHV